MIGNNWVRFLVITIPSEHQMTLGLGVGCKWMGGEEYKY